jgi:hypothetical protein
MEVKQMRSTSEIKQKIDEYIEKTMRETDAEKRENLYHVIDALLWVIGDQSGAPI